ncbi:uncharacterized protein F4822DRAFT_431900 [Hypoxylon trugodes]|uniref:uncharacterized protein n=1 Tax=Hypoxylon trugodes TaxID=326681 RepID=UPI00219499AF|nr:uncharacterized protein F4822DRAFT_431900 [Hypoxylon trugodes]KAI1387032.1 hypothetical protein F4822DRAFT_431900 [Hypoxylon trugodes]
MSDFFRDSPPPSTDGRIVDDTVSVLDSLLGGSGDDEASLRTFPILSSDAYERPITQMQRGTQASTGGISTPPTRYNANGMVGYHYANGANGTNGTNGSHDILGLHDVQSNAPIDEEAPADTSSVRVRPIRYPDPDPTEYLSNPTLAAYGISANEPTKINFIVSHPEVADGLIEAVHNELGRANINAKLELRQVGQGKYLEIITPKRHAAEIIGAAQDATEELIADRQSTGPPRNFQEPPIGIGDTAKVILVINTQSGEIRPKLVPGINSTAELQLPQSREDYVAKLCHFVHKGLKKAGRVRLSLSLRVHLGYFLLRSYPKGKEISTYPEFYTMMMHPRAGGVLKKSIGGKDQARKVLDFIKNDADHLFLPTSNQVEATADVLPEYIFEIRSRNYKLYAPIKKRSSGNARGAMVCQLYRIMASKLDDNFTELDILNLSVGKNLDWKLEAVQEEKGEISFRDITEYLRSAKIELNNADRPHDLDVYPSVKLGLSDMVASKVKNATVKTVYRYRWKTTPYIVEIAVSRHWDRIFAMEAGRDPIVELEISVFGEFWDATDETAGNVWGNELELLLDTPQGKPEARGMDRVEGFVEVIKEIRNTLHGLF